MQALVQASCGKSARHSLTWIGHSIHIYRNYELAVLGIVSNAWVTWWHVTLFPFSMKLCKGSQGRQGGIEENSLGYRKAIRCIQPCGQLHSKTASDLLSAPLWHVRLVIHTLASAVKQFDLETATVGCPKGQWIKFHSVLPRLMHSTCILSLQIPTTKGEYSNFSDYLLKRTAEWLLSSFSKQGKEKLITNIHESQTSLYTLCSCWDKNFLGISFSDK